MAADPFAQFARVHDLAIDQHKRLVWAPAITNGAAIVALGNIVANASNQDATFSAVTVPLAIVGLGLLTAAVAAHMSANVASTMSNVVTKATTATEALQRAQERVQTLARELPNESPEAHAARVVGMAQVASQMERHIDGLKALHTSQSSTLLQSNLADWINGISMALAAGGFAYLLVGHTLGWFRLGG